jgi:biopolymer transport protein ExbB
VVGMMRAFQVIGSEGIVNPTAVTGGVAEALIATVVGLIIARCPFHTEQGALCFYSAD